MLFSCGTWSIDWSGKGIHTTSFLFDSVRKWKCANPLLRRNRDGIFLLEWRSHERGKKISPWITKGTLYFPQEWLSRRGEKKFHHEWRSHEWWNFFLPQLLSHEWGKYNVPWVMNGEIYPSLFLLSKGFSFLWREGKLHHYFTHTCLNT